MTPASAWAQVPVYPNAPPAPTNLDPAGSGTQAPAAPAPAGPKVVVVDIDRRSIDDVGPPYCLHGLNAVFLPEHGWYRVDPRGNVVVLHGIMGAELSTVGRDALVRVLSSKDLRAVINRELVTLLVDSPTPACTAVRTGRPLVIRSLAEYAATLAAAGAGRGLAVLRRG